MNLDALRNQFHGRKFGELVLHHLKSQSQNNIILGLQGTVNLLPVLFQKNEIEKLIDEFNEKAYTQSFWQNDCAETFSFIIKRSRESFLQIGLNPNEDDLFNVFNIIVLNFAYSASTQYKMKIFIKNSTNKHFFVNFFRKKDISENYKWSIIFKKNGVPQYELLCDSVNKMLGLIMVHFGSCKNPIKPWKLILRLNKNGKELELEKKYFFASDIITNELYNLIKEIDCDLDYKYYKEAIFINRVFGAIVKIENLEDMVNNSNESIKCLENGTYEEWIIKNESNETFYNVLNKIFN